MKRLNLIRGILLLVLSILVVGCDFEELSASKDEPRCNVYYSVVFNNTSKTDVYMGMNANPSAAEVVKAGSSRTVNNAINLLLSHKHEEEHLVEMHIRSLDNQKYQYRSYFIRPKEWTLAVDPKDFKVANLTLQVVCAYNGSEVGVTVTQK